MGTKLKLLTTALLLISVTSLNAAWKYSDYDAADHSNFRKNPIFSATINPENIDYPLINAAVFFVSNETRVRHGRTPLEYSPELETAAWNHSREMSLKKFFSHYNSSDAKRKTPSDRARLAGIKNPKIAENIAGSHGIKLKPGVPVYPKDVVTGSFSYSPHGEIIPYHTYLSLADALVNQWMNSSGHRANLLSPKGLQMGCGVYFYRDINFFNILKCNATQNFQWFMKIEKGPAADSPPPAGKE